MNTTHRLRLALFFTLVLAAPLAAGLDPKDVVEASRLIEKIAKYSAEIRAAAPAAALVAPEPRRDNAGKYLSPYKADGSLAEWADKAIQAAAGSAVGRAVGDKLGDKAAETLAGKIPGGALVGGFLKKKVKDKAGEAGAKLAVGGADFMRSTSDISFDTPDALAVYLQVKHANIDAKFAQALAATFGIYPELRENYEPAVKAAYSGQVSYASGGAATSATSAVAALTAAGSAPTGATAPDLSGAPPARAVADLPVVKFDSGDFKLWGDKILGRTPRVAVAGFRVGFILKDKVTASTAAGYQFGGTHTSGAKSTTEVELHGVNAQVLQDITETLYAEFVAALQAAGREVVPVETIKATPAWAKLDATDAAPGKPYLKEPSVFHGRYYAVMTPAALPLWWDHGNPIGDQGPMSIGNYKVMCAVSSEHDCLVVFPTYLVHFAELQSSGRKHGAFSGYAKGASTGAKPNLSIIGGSTVMNMLYAKNAVGGFGQNHGLKENAVVGEFGADMVKLAQASNAGDGTRASLQGLAQATGNLGFFAAAGPTRSQQTLAVQTDPGTFRAHVLAALRGVVEANTALFRTGGK
jgi:hypothetical protein